MKGVNDIKQVRLKFIRRETWKGGGAHTDHYAAVLDGETADCIKVCCRRGRGFPSEWLAEFEEMERTVSFGRGFTKAQAEAEFLSMWKRTEARVAKLLPELSEGK